VPHVAHSWYSGAAYESAASKNARPGFSISRAVSRAGLSETSHIATSTKVSWCYHPIARESQEAQSMFTPST
jgi:hypothetical protein